MRRIPYLFLLVFLVFYVLNVWAQKEKKADGAENKESAAKGPVIYTYLGKSDLKGGTIPKHVFDSLLKQGIRCRDEAGHSYNIERFRFNYAERNLYEDSIGNLKIMTDYMLDFCFGDTVSSSISAEIYEHTKQGDTAYIDNVVVSKPDGKSASSKSMKFVIGK